MILQLTTYNYGGRYIQLKARPTAAMSLARVVVRSGGCYLWRAHRSHRYSKTETPPPSVWLRAVAESTGQYGFHARIYCHETPRSFYSCRTVDTDSVSMRKSTILQDSLNGIKTLTIVVGNYSGPSGLCSAKDGLAELGITSI